jgi:hypothetical protein
LAIQGAGRAETIGAESVRPGAACAENAIEIQAMTASRRIPEVRLPIFGRVRILM